MAKLNFTLRGIWLIFFFILLRVPILFAQAEKGVFDRAKVKNYNQASGLPQNTINDFCFDKFGYMWLATWGGLSRFDGKYFKNDFGYLESFPSKSRIAALIIKNPDTMYALTFEQKVLIIAQGNIIGYETYSVKKHGIFFGNSQVAVPAPASITDSNFEDYSRKGYWGIQYTCLGFRYGKDSFGIVGKNLFLYNHLGVFKQVSLPQHDINTFNDNWKIYVLNNNVVTLDNNARVLRVYNTEGNVSRVPLPQSNTRWRIYKSTGNRSLFAADGKRLYEIQKDSSSNMIKFTKLLDQFEDTMSINRICNLGNKYLVISTVNKGFFIFHNSSVQTFSPPAKNMYANFLYAQALMPDDSTILSGVRFVFGRSGYKRALKGVQPVLATDLFYLANINRVIFKDSKKYYWYTREVKDSFRFDLMKSLVPGSPGAVKIMTLNKTIYCLFEDKNGNIWINNNDNLGYFIRGTTNYVKVLSDISKNKYINPLKINCFIEDSTKGMFIGSSQGVLLFDPQKPGTPIKKFLLDSTEIRFLKFNSNTGGLWIGTYGKGLWILKKSGELLQVPNDREGNMSVVHYAVIDSNNKVWFSTNNGIYVTTKKSLDDFETNSFLKPYYYKLSTYDGLADNECNGACYQPMILQPDGTLTVSSAAGLVWLNTNNMVFDFPGNMLQAVIFRHNITYPPNTQYVEIGADDNKELLIEVIAPGFSPDYNTQLQYKIVRKEGGIESGWQDINDRHQILLPFLLAGTYEIQIRKRIGFNENDFIFYSITVNKKFFWYQTAYLYPVLITFLSLIAYLLYLWRTVSLRRKNKLLQEKIAVATTNLQIKNDELQKTVQTRDSLILLFNHDLSTPLFYINRMAQSIAVEDKEKSVYAGTLQILADATQDLEELMNDMLLWIQIQQKNSVIQIVNEPVNVNELLERTFGIFGHRLSYNNINVKLKIPEDIIVNTDKRVFNSILYNIVINAIKYTRNGVIVVEKANDIFENSHLSLVIRSKSDTNALPALQPGGNYNAIGNLQKSKPLTGTSEQGHQIGLQLVQNFSYMLNLKVVYDNSVEEIFTIIISGLSNVGDVISPPAF